MRWSWLRKAQRSLTWLLLSRQLNDHRSGALSVASWNVNGIRAVIKHDPSLQVLKNFLNVRRPDILCLQETKLQEMHVEEIDLFIKKTLGIRTSYWSCSRARKGYSGVAMLVLNDELIMDGNHEVRYGIGDELGDLEGRSITLTHPQFSICNVYVPNSGSGLKKLSYRTDEWDYQLSKHMLSLIHQRSSSDGIDYVAPVVLTGDLNVAHRYMDYYNPHDLRTKKQPGTTVEEQKSFESQFLHSCGLFDSFRALHPERSAYSFFAARNGEAGRVERKGMRLDYVLCSPGTELLSQLGEHAAYVDEKVRKAKLISDVMMLDIFTSVL